MFTATNSARFVTTPSNRTGFVHFLNTLIAAHRSRIALANLSDAARTDAGLTEADIQAELARSLWDVVGTWKR